MEKPGRESFLNHKKIKISRKMAKTFFFVSDLHGHINKYQILFDSILTHKPEAVFLGGDLLPHEYYSRKNFQTAHGDFINEFLVKRLYELRKTVGEFYPRIFIILGNDDSKTEEPSLVAATNDGILEYIHFRNACLHHYLVLGYANIPPSPFTLKDWEKYDVSRFVDPGCVSPEEGFRTVPVPTEEVRYGTIQQDLSDLTDGLNLENSIFLFHCPPYHSQLDRADLDGQMIDHVPLDVHIGSIAIQRFIEEKQPLITLHGHVHESSRLTGAWKQKIGQTVAISAAYEGSELALVKFDPEDPDNATREIIS
jgi:Icc-related predicted phosphoesterase